jgi:hypothetical protein
MRILGLTAIPALALALLLAVPGGGAAAVGHPEIAVATFPPGWNVTEQNITFTNYTLPAWPGTRAWEPNGSFDSPVVTVSDVYFVNLSGELVDLRLASRDVRPLAPWPTNLSTAGDPAELTAFTTPTGTPEVLYDIGISPAHTVEVAWYDLLNQTFRFESTDLPAASGDVSEGVLNVSGWIYWMIDGGTQLDVLNIYSEERVSAALPSLGSWNSAVYIPSADQVVEDVNSYTSATIEFRTFNLSLAGGVPTLDFRTFYSPTASFVLGDDLNNMPYLYNFTGNRTNLWSIGLDDPGAAPTYHLVTAVLYPDLALDRATNVTDLGLVGTTDTQAVALYDPSGYFFNGGDDARDQWAYQAPFLNPEAERAIFSNTSQWFDDVMDQNLGFGLVAPWVGEWEFTSSAPWANAVETGDAGKGGGGIILLYSIGPLVAPGPGLNLAPWIEPIGFSLVAVGVSTSAYVVARRRGMVPPSTGPRAAELDSLLRHARGAADR